MPRNPASHIPDPPAPPRRATNVTLPEALLREARELGINLSQACERGLVSAVAEVKAERWLRENRAAIDAWNDHVERHGMPLSEFRQF
ncbi:type II toxin-antitoxin system CcdA family antitoxin [Roseomonas hellenica]|uniref:Type II toxin-antitoxin system CcdA family antitoxin n=1 Tax=Plastoroseomonas hellenica TaxID=2687306 RepID=A0ABS5EXB5_9PROT|nr:type II toxin-antitoxin system CcdA family antitoxin [Plastoroseomonas hellenica]MBR0664940.1 type II toxin-antitoxin system CcdA family antitoxin [Plastoroseomonas hellenica]